MGQGGFIMSESFLRKEKIREALDLLSEAARKQKEEVGELLSGRYEGLRKDLAEIEKNLSSSMGKVFKRFEETAGEGKVRETVERVEKKVHQNPWPALGIASLLGLLLGILFSRKR
jgi:ElaB protein